MKPTPTLRGRYERSVFSPLQWAVLAAVGYAIVLGLQVDTLLHTSFRLELFDQEVVRVQHPARTAPAVPRFGAFIDAPAPSVTPEDWPAPPPVTRWGPARQTDRNMRGADHRALARSRQ